jgi:branched-subunit amino acid ABC-type transport system permease component
MALIIIIFGGMGQFGGAIIAGLILGVLYNLTVYYVGSKLGDLVPFGVLLIVLMVRPRVARAAGQASMTSACSRRKP